MLRKELIVMVYIGYFFRSEIIVNELSILSNIHAEFEDLSAMDDGYSG